MAARVPRPGGPVRGSTTGRALMAALDLLGRRWALRILWELRAEPLGARALQARCDRMSSSVLYERLAELTAAGLLARDEAGAYLLTDLGAALAPALESLDSWARRWAQVLQETDRTPDTRDSLPRSSGPPHRARDTTGRSVKDLHPERTVVFRPPHRHGPADASPVTAGLPKPATGPWSPDRNCHPRARDRVYQAHGLVLRLGREDPMAQQQNHTHPVSAEVFRQVYDSPVSLPGRDRWLTSDEDVRKVEEILGMPQRTIGAPLWVRAMLETCGSAGKGRDVKEGCTFPVTES